MYATDCTDLIVAGLKLNKMTSIIPLLSTCFIISFLSIFVDRKVEDNISLTTENIENLNFNLLVGIIVLSVLLLNILIISCFMSNYR